VIVVPVDSFGQVSVTSSFPTDLAIDVDGFYLNTLANGDQFPISGNIAGQGTILGQNTSTANNSSGILGQITSASPGLFSAGLRGINNGTGGSGIGVWGSQAGGGYGVYGTTAGAGWGVRGEAGAGGTGAYGSAGLNGIGVDGTVFGSGDSSAGVRGINRSTADNAFGVIGQITSTSPGGFSAGLRGINNGTGGTGYGVWGSQNGSGVGVYGTVAGAGRGVYGSAGSDGSGVYGTGHIGVVGVTASATYGIPFDGAGVIGAATTGQGVKGQAFGGFGVFGSDALLGGIGVFGSALTGPNTYAGFFNGNVQVTGTLSKGGGSFKIDDPIDPLNKYLYHSFVESPDMMNIYNGIVTTDANGNATVALPDYFMALNQDYRWASSPR
jgi:hypothetical protein